jgi:hypothetical protein
MRVAGAAAAASIAAGIFGGSAVMAVAGVSHAALHRIGTASPGMLQSTNWSGDAVTGKTYKRVTATWVVPTVTVTVNNRYASDWVGIGGFSSGDLIQAGTAEQSVGGSAQYYAWTEVLPQPEVPISGFAVHPGDSMTVDVLNTTSRRWTITVKNNTTGQSSVRHFRYSSLHSSAEWIHEAPTVGGTQAQLATTTNANFDFGKVNGTIVIGSAGTQHQIQLIGLTDATPSNLDSDADGLAVADGLSQPPPPRS